MRSRAVGIPRFGGPEVLEVVSLPVRAPGPGEVRIRVAAAAVNPTDLLTRSGANARALPEAFEAMEPPYVPGMDAAGTVDAAGEGVERLRPDQAVMAAVRSMRPEGGAQRELLVVPAASVVPLPDGADARRAATLPMNGLTATEALDLLGLSPGDTLAITGGAGWLSALAIPLAVERGIRTIADARSEDRDLVLGYGADQVVERGEGLARRIRDLVPAGVDGLLDAALIGPAALPAIRDGGGWAVLRGHGVDEPTERGIRRHVVSVGRRLEDTAALEHLRELASAGRLPMTVAGEYPPERAGEAHRRMEAGGVRGRLVIAF